MPHSPTDSTSTKSTQSSRNNTRHPKSWPSTTSPQSVSSTSSLSSLSSSTTASEKPTLSGHPDHDDDDAVTLLNHTPSKTDQDGGGPKPIPTQAQKRGGDSNAKKASKRHCIDFDWSYKNVYAAAAGGRKVVSGSAALGGGRAGCGLM